MQGKLFNRMNTRIISKQMLHYQPRGQRSGIQWRDGSKIWGHTHGLILERKKKNHTHSIEHSLNLLQYELLHYPVGVCATLSHQFNVQRLKIFFTHHFKSFFVSTWFGWCQFLLAMDPISHPFSHLHYSLLPSCDWLPKESQSLQ
jgi:hypothetical protein